MLEGVFRPLLPFAAENNVRILLPNARDIGKSTPYTEAELKAIQSKDKTLENAFMRDAVAELGSFFAWFVTHNDIPPFKEDARGKKTGGISLIGWSAAGDWFIPFFAMADAIPERIRATIEPYVRSLLTYGENVILDACFVGSCDGDLSSRLSLLCYWAP